MGKSSKKEAGQVREVTWKGTLCSCWDDRSGKKEEWYLLRKPLKQAWVLDLHVPLGMPGRETILKDHGVQSMPKKKTRGNSP